MNIHQQFADPIISENIGNQHQIKFWNANTKKTTLRTILRSKYSIALKFLLDRGERVRAVLTQQTIAFRRWFKEDWKSPCVWKQACHQQKKNKHIIDIYKDIVPLHYDEREETFKVGSFQEIQGTKHQTVSPKAKKKKSRCFTDEVFRTVPREKDIQSRKMLRRENHWKRRK